MTIRRDLEHLDGLGLIVKVHGGASIPLQRSADEPGFAAKSSRNTAEKLAIATACARLVAPGSAVGVTAGTTTVQLARLLTEVPRLTIVTNSLAVAREFHEVAASDATVILTGGVRTPSDALVGPIATAALNAFHLDLLFMGVHGMHEKAGFTTPNLLEAETNRAFMAAATEVVVAADHTKWGLAGLTTMADLCQADTVVSDPQLDERAHQVLADLGVRVTVAGSQRTASSTV